MNSVFHRLLFPSLSSLMALAVLFFLLIPRMPEMAQDPGLGWHLMSGEEILRSGGTVPRVDTYLGTPVQHQWVADQWLGSTILAAIFSAASWEGLTGFTLILFFLLFFPLLYRSAFLASGSALASVLAVSTTCKLSSLHLIVRPIVPSLFLFGVVTYLLYSGKRSLQEEDKLPHSLWALPAIFFLWTNIHPYFLVGLIYLGVWTAGVVLDKVVLESKLSIEGTLLTLISIFVLSILLTLLNPYDAELYRAVFSLGSSEFFTSFLDEWRPLQVKTAEWEIVHLIAVLLILASIFSEEFRKRWGFSELLIALGLLFFTLQSVRGAPLFAICTTPLLATAFRDLASLTWFGRFPLAASLGRLFSLVDARETRGSHSLFGALIGAVTILLLFFFSPHYFGDLTPSQKTFPWKAVSSLVEHGEPKDVVFNHLDWGGFIVFKTQSKLRPVIDDRLTVTPEARYKEYLVAYNNPEKLLTLFPETDFILTPPTSPPALYFSSSAKGDVLFKDHLSILIRVKGGKE